MQRYQKQEQEQPEPNLVCRTTQVSISHVDLHGQILVKGPQTYQYIFEPDTYVVVAEIENEFSLSRKVGHAEGITAQIFYKLLPRGEVVVRVNRGAWLSIGNKVSLGVNDTANLVIAGFPASDPYLFAFVKEYSGAFQPLEEITTPLQNDFYLVEVRLISEAKSLLVQTLNFNLEVTRTPRWDIKLTEIKDLTPLEIRRTVEAFLKEGSDMLNSFPRMGEVSAEIERIDEWETRSTRFLSEYPDLFSTAFFLSDYPEESPSGLAHGTSWPSLKRLATRLSRLKEFLDELRKN